MDDKLKRPIFYVSFAEIYNEEVHDLLDPRGERGSGSGEDMTGDIVLTGVKEERIAIATESDESLTRAILAILHQGALGRTTKSTAMNHQSSRSHAIFTLTLRQTRNSTQLVSKLHFVDLAGSERLKRTGAEGSGRGRGLRSMGDCSPWEMSSRPSPIRTNAPCIFPIGTAN